MNSARQTPAFAVAGLFDPLAQDYDEGFTDTRLGRLLREAVWRRLDARFGPGDHVLDVGCGTGEDAVHLALRGVRVVATDISAPMLEVARAKAAARGAAHLVEVRQMAAEDLRSLAEEEGPRTMQAGGRSSGRYDGAYSNFGVLNCVADLRAAARGLAARIRPGGVAVLCVMGPACPWEWAWQLAHLRPGKAFRRLRPGGARWRSAVIRYPSVRKAARAFTPEFRVLRAAAVGALVPPPCAEEWARRHWALVERLNRLERRWECAPPLPALADHYLLELARR